MLQSTLYGFTIPSTSQRWYCLPSSQAHCKGLELLLRVALSGITERPATSRRRFHLPCTQAHLTGQNQELFSWDSRLTYRPECRLQPLVMYGAWPEAQGAMPGPLLLCEGTTVQNIRRKDAIVVRRQRGLAGVLLQRRVVVGPAQNTGSPGSQGESGIISPFFRSTPLPGPGTPKGCPAIHHTRCSGYR